MPWVHAILRGTKVLARVDAGGSLVSENGRVEIRYKPNDGRRYGARADNLKVVSGEILPEETCGPATSVDSKSTGASSSPGSTRGSAPASRQAKGTGDGAETTGGEDDAPHTTEAHHSESHGATKAIHIYADGACSGNPGPAGLGVVVLDSESRIEISEYIGSGTNNIAELTAILRALGETADSDRPLLIHTDSSYSIGVLQKGWKAKANQELVAELREHLRARKGIKLIYVPGHAGVRWNERADALARAAVASRSSSRHVVRASDSRPPPHEKSPTKHRHSSPT